MKLPKELTQVTRISRLLALIIFLVALFVAFVLGMQYQATLDFTEEQLIRIQSTAVTTDRP